MILHDFTYRWDGKSHDGTPPIAWWPGAYRVRIVEFGSSSKGVHFLFPRAVIMKGIKTDGQMNTALENYIHNFAQKLSKEYDLDIHKTLWMEIGDPIRVAHLNPDRKLTDKTLFSFFWRSIRPNEQKIIDPYLEGL